MTTTASRRPQKVTFRDRLLRLAGAVTTPVLPDDYLDLIAPLRAGARCAAGSSPSGRRPGTPPRW